MITKDRRVLRVGKTFGSIYTREQKVGGGKEVKIGREK